MDRGGQPVSFEPSESPPSTVLYVDEEEEAAEEARDTIERERETLTVHTLSSLRDALEYLTDDEADAVVSGYELSDGTGIDLLSAVRGTHPDVPFILFTEQGSEDVASEAISLGVTDYLQRDAFDDPFSVLGTRVEEAIDARLESDTAEQVREWYRTLIERSPGIIAVVDDDAEFIYRSPSTEHELGYEPESMIGETPFDYIHPDHHERVRRVFESVMDGERRVSDSYQYKYEVAEGAWRWFESVIIDQSDSTIGGYVIYSRDITERKHRQHELDRERELFERVLNTSPTGIVVFDTAGTIRRANDRAMEILGVSTTEITDQLFEYSEWEFLDEEGEPIPGDRLPFQRVIDRDEPVYDFECRLVNASGDTRWLSINTVPMAAPDGGFEHAISTLSDITEQKEHQQALEASQARYQSLTEDVLDTSEVGTVILDADLEVVWINAAVERFFGVDRESVLGTQATEIVDGIKDVFEDSEQFERRVLQAYEDNVGVEEFECHVLPGEDRSERWLSHWSRPIETGLYEGGRIAHYTDITDQKKRDQQLDAMDRVLRHNLHNELTIIIGGAETVVEMTDGELAAFAEMIAESGRELLNVTGKQREIIELLSKEPTRTEVDVSEGVRRRSATMNETHPAAEFQLVVPEGVRARAIPQIDEAVSELLENAVVHADDPEPVVEVAVEEAADQVRIRVTDTGPGIPAAERAVLLGEGETGALYHGSGMGLWLVNWIVTYSEGSVAYAENDRGGNTIEIRLPSASADP